ncbi:MAG: DUF58 domain-containing protein [Chthoniobacteraceae bacterium]|nr:DUF58 domain-containing protein [Chthoniobacteraceae bacterium]
MPNPGALDFNVLARIDSMQLLAKVVVEGFVLGLHRSPYRGFSVEFAEYRQYAQGDEVKHVDWKVYGKTDRYYIKQFEEETNLACYLIVDASASMGYRTGPEGMTKLQYASRIAACLSYFMVRQRDAAGLMIFDTKIRTVLPPRMRQTHLKHIFAALETAEPGGETDISQPLHQLADGLKRKGLVILISDLLDEPEQVISALQHFRFQGHEVIVFQVMDNGELTFPFNTITEFTDLETGQKTLVSPEGMKPVYMEELRRFLAAYEKGCAGIHADYKLFDTSNPLEIALSEYLYRRSRMG